QFSTPHCRARRQLCQKPWRVGGLCQICATVVRRVPIEPRPIARVADPPRVQSPFAHAVVSLDEILSLDVLSCHTALDSSDSQRQESLVHHEVHGWCSPRIVRICTLLCNFVRIFTF